MPNRIIKESICFSDSLLRLSARAEIFFYRLMVKCDDHGAFYAKPQLLKSQCFPLVEEGISSADVEGWLLELEKEEIIVIYENSGKEYLKFTNWASHQQIRNKKRKYPMPNDPESRIIVKHTFNHELISDDIKNKQIETDDMDLQESETNENNGNQMIAFAPVIQSNPIQSESNSESNSILSDVPILDKEPEEEKDRKEKPPSQKAIDKTFNSIWEQYPRKEGKGKITSKRKLVLYQIGEDHLKRAVGRYVNDKRDTEYQFLQMGSTFFNSGIVDYLDENYKPPSRNSTAGNIKSAGPNVRPPTQNFTSRVYDTNALKEKLVNRGRGESHV